MSLGAINGSVSNWKPVTSDVLQGSVLGQTSLNIFVVLGSAGLKPQHSSITVELSALASFWMTPSRMVQLICLREDMPSRGILKGLKSGAKVLRLGCGISQCQYRLGEEWIETSPVEMDLEILVD